MSTIRYATFDIGKSICEFQSNGTVSCILQFVVTEVRNTVKLNKYNPQCVIPIASLSQSKVSKDSTKDTKVTNQASDMLRKQRMHRVNFVGGNIYRFGLHSGV